MITDEELQCIVEQGVWADLNVMEMAEELLKFRAQKLKVNWEDAPEWAGWFAVDEDGSAFWYERKPETAKSGYWTTGGIGKLCEHRSAMRDIWLDSLEERPR
jgi:hypothetical protein